MGRLPIHGRTVVAAIGATAGHTEKGTLFGLLAGIGMLSAAIAFGGSAKSFVDLPSLLIVFGRLELLVNSVLPPAMWIRYFD